METRDILKYIAEELHSTVFATADETGRPVTCPIDIMDRDENSLYFLTARGKSFYKRLKSCEDIALTAMKGESTLSSLAVSLQGKAREIGVERLNLLFEKNDYMKKIYPDEGSRQALTVFQIYEGAGEWFDLRKLPVERFSFSFGGAEKKGEGYVVTDKCIGCKLCYYKCPQKCIDIGQIPVFIRKENCIRCGNCFEICPKGAVERL